MKNSFPYLFSLLVLVLLIGQFTFQIETLYADEPDLSVWRKYIEEYSKYFQEKYSPSIKSRYDLYRRDIKAMQKPDYSEAAYPVEQKKTVKRWVDCVLIEGKDLPNLLGQSFENIRVLTFNHGKWEVIPFQFDEYTKKGEKVLPEGPKNNASDGDGKLDHQDELILMSYDLGDRVAKKAWPQDIQSGIEVKAQEPDGDEAGWFYIFTYEDNAPDLPSLTYNEVVIPPINNPDGYRAYSPTYFLHGKTTEFGGKKYDQIFYQSLWQSRLAGGTEVDFVDRLKWRLRIRFLFGVLKIKFHEDNLTGSFIAWKEGPVKSTYRVGAVAHMGMGLKSPQVLADVIQIGENVISTSTIMNVPFNPGHVITDLTNRIGTDLTPAAKGMTFYNSNNLEGFKIDGSAGKENKMNHERDEWRLITGPQGSLMNRSYWSPNFITQVKSIEVLFVDDEKEKDPPEFIDGQIGAVYSKSVVSNLKPGIYDIGIEWYFINDFHNPDKLDIKTINEYLRFQDNPLLLTIDDKTFPSKNRPVLRKR